MKTSGRFSVVRGTSDGVFSIARGKKGILQSVVFMGGLVLPKILSEKSRTILKKFPYCIFIDGVYTLFCVRRGSIDWIFLFKDRIYFNKMIVNRLFLINEF